MSYIRSDEAGKFLAFLVDKDVKGAINGSSDGTISLREIIRYVEIKTGTKAIFDKEGEKAPYNGEPEYSINTDRAKALGFHFTTLKDGYMSFWTIIFSPFKTKCDDNLIKRRQLWEKILVLSIYILKYTTREH